MELIITIPKEFEAHFKQDKFKDSFGRICYDIENAFKKQEGVSGRYEHELAEMLDDAFAKAQVSPTDELRRQKRKRCLAMAEWCDAEADVADADGDYEDMRWYQKWHERWTSLAEKFETQPHESAKEQQNE